MPESTSEGPAWIPAVLGESGAGAPGQERWLFWVESHRSALYLFLRHSGYGRTEAARLLVRFGGWCGHGFGNGSEGGGGVGLRESLCRALRTFLDSEPPPTGERFGEDEPGSVEIPTPFLFPELELRYEYDRAYGGTTLELFRRRWALNVLERVLGRLHLEQTGPLDRDRWQLRRRCLTGESVACRASGEGVRGGTDSHGAWVRRLRARFVTLLAAEVGGVSGVAEEIKAHRQAVVGVRIAREPLGESGRESENAPAEDGSVAGVDEVRGDRCRRCDSEKPLDAPWGLCPRCLFDIPGTED